MVNFVREALLKETDPAKRDRLGIITEEVAKGKIMMGKISVELLIFDLDGTLIESKWDIAASVNLTLASWGSRSGPSRNLWVRGGWGEATVALVDRRGQPGHVRRGVAGVQEPVLGSLPRSYDVLSRCRTGADPFRASAKAVATNKSIGIRMSFSKD
jgi:hypothetical protein